MDYKSGKIDLHIHSNASDGSLAPAQILSQAAVCGLAAISITDHDTVAGVKTALQIKLSQGPAFISGVEISAEFPPGFNASGSMHLLGYGFDPYNQPLAELLEKQQQSRARRNPRILEKLADLGIDIHMADIAAEARKNEIARPHIAAHMVKNGYAASIDDAFDRFLAKGQPAYVDRFRIKPEEAIFHIHQSGGVAVLAHPGLLVFELGGELEKLVAGLAAMGLDGLEAYYSSHSPRQTAAFEAIAEKYDLLLTGGSDFHGDINPEIRMGKGAGDLHVPYEIFVRLCRALQDRTSTG
ncbi:MAG: PHP domain-containing protein [Desulfosalsimonas sp.]|uniref:PHP domain-containing protein n=1 Tax=Desulfosalsimonas sp. TaxID=3073848 RepID=UPI003970D38C